MEQTLISTNQRKVLTNRKSFSCVVRNASFCVAPWLANNQDGLPLPSLWAWDDYPVHTLRQGLCRKHHHGLLALGLEQTNTLRRINLDMFRTGSTAAADNNCIASCIIPGSKGIVVHTRRLQDSCRRTNGEEPLPRRSNGSCKVVDGHVPVVEPIVSLNGRSDYRARRRYPDPLADRKQARRLPYR
ncbi:MAG: hypothetical protein KatS3mg040_0456 [Candidatus Kapaibacterium sp.]|nr:MAG: hypothetical protein KatS3mg040_0456 [Candidatus Kapabacteria bacterium]